MSIPNVFCSIVVPVYRSEETLELLAKKIGNIFEELGQSYELILVDDSSPGNDWTLIKSLIDLYNGNIIGLRLSRNFGQHNAITAGIDLAMGQWIIVMDCDLQDRPEEIPKFFEYAEKGYEVILARRKIRQDRFFKRLFSKLFYQVLTFLTGTKHDPAVANFGLYKKNVIDAIRSMRESIRFFPVMVRWVGFHTVYVDVQHDPREFGTTSYTYKSLIKLAINILLSFSDRPLSLVIRLGFLICSFAFIGGIYVLSLALNNGFSSVGWASIVISIWFLSGVLILVLGCIGLYVGKIFQQVRNRPIYVVQEKYE